MHQEKEEGERITCHGIPAAHGHQATVFILCHQVVQHGAVVDKGVQVPIEHSSDAIGHARFVISAGERGERGV